MRSRQSFSMVRWCVACVAAAAGLGLAVCASAQEAEAPILLPGGGWTGPTPQPPPVGSGPGADAKAIARWDVVPYQTIDCDFEVGVVAFHINGIDRVEFSVENGPWVPVKEMTLNPRTKVWEYWARLSCDAFPSDGQIELRAIAYPKVGIPRVLDGPIDGGLEYSNGNHAMFLSVNGRGTLPSAEVWASSSTGNDATGDGTRERPFATVARALASVTAKFGKSDGARCYLTPGDYGWSMPVWPNTIKTETRWATVLSAPGVDPAQVRFVSSAVGGLGTKLIKAEGITFYGSAALRGDASRYMWVDKCVATGNNREEGGGFAASLWGGVFVTDSLVYNVRTTFGGAHFVRNSEAHDYTQSPLNSAAMVLNVRLRDFYNHSSGDHGDVFHWFWNSAAPRENRIIYGLNVTGFHYQAWQCNAMKGGSQQLDNVALVNIHVSKDLRPGEAPYLGSWWSIDSKHLILIDVQTPDHPLRWKVHADDADGVLSLSNVGLQNCVFKSFMYGPLPADTRISHMHLMELPYEGFVPEGFDVTVGKPGEGATVEELFVAPRSLDYRPISGCIIDRRVHTGQQVVPADLLGNTFGEGLHALGAFGASTGVP